VYRNPDIAVGEWPARDRRRPDAVVDAQTLPRDTARRFTLLRWILIVGLVTILAISILFAAVLSHFMTREILDHDATLTSQFIDSIAETQSSQASLGSNATLGQILDEIRKWRARRGSSSTTTCDFCQTCSWPMCLGATA
jgi:hypothetical protein